MRLRDEREAVGIPQVAIVERLGIDQSSLSHSERLPIERVRRRTRERYRAALAEAVAQRRDEDQEASATLVVIGLAGLVEA